MMSCAGGHMPTTSLIHVERTMKMVDAKAITVRGLGTNDHAASNQRCPRSSPPLANGLRLRCECATPKPESAKKKGT
eukprot:5998251-Prymnesium_polylepis.3